MRTVTLIALAALAAQAQDYDFLIAGGRIVDGTGNPSFIGDVALNGNRVAAVGRLAGKTARRTINAAGLTVTPGFIDIPNHSDYTIAADRDAPSMIRQGGTSLLFGEGETSAPIGGQQARHAAAAARPR